MIFARVLLAAAVNSCSVIKVFFFFCLTEPAADFNRRRNFNPVSNCQPLLTRSVPVRSECAQFSVLIHARYADRRIYRRRKTAFRKQSDIADVRQPALLLPGSTDSPPPPNSLLVFQIPSALNTLYFTFATFPPTLFDRLAMSYKYPAPDTVSCIVLVILQ